MDIKIENLAKKNCGWALAVSINQAARLPSLGGKVWMEKRQKERGEMFPKVGNLHNFEQAELLQ